MTPYDIRREIERCDEILTWSRVRWTNAQYNRLWKARKRLVGALVAAMEETADRAEDERAD